MPQGRVTAGGRSGRFDDAVGRGFALVSTVDVASALAGEQRRFLDELGCRVVRLGTDVTDDDGVHTAYLEQVGAVAYLARPDYVLFGAAGDAEEAGALVDELRADLAWAPQPPRSAHDRGATAGGTRSGGRRAAPGDALHPAGRLRDEPRRRPRPAGRHHGRPGVGRGRRRARRRPQCGRAVRARRRAPAHRGPVRPLGRRCRAVRADGRQRGHPRKRRLYRRYVDLVSQVADLSEPALERVELPYRDGRLVAWLGLPPSGRAAATVVL